METIIKVGLFIGGFYVAQRSTKSCLGYYERHNRNLVKRQEAVKGIMDEFLEKVSERTDA